MLKHCGTKVDSFGKRLGQHLGLCPLPTNMVIFEGLRTLFVHKLSTVSGYFTQAPAQPIAHFNGLIYGFYTQATGLTNTTKLIKGY
jgi:hypothetical protein